MMVLSQTVIKTNRFTMNLLRQTIIKTNCFTMNLLRQTIIKINHLTMNLLRQTIITTNRFTVNLLRQTIPGKSTVCKILVLSKRIAFYHPRTINIALGRFLGNSCFWWIWSHFGFWFPKWLDPMHKLASCWPMFEDNWITSPWNHIPTFSQAGRTSNHPAPAPPLHHLVLMKRMLILLTLEGAASLLLLGYGNCADHVGLEVEHATNIQ